MTKAKTHSTVSVVEVITEVGVLASGGWGWRKPAGFSDPRAVFRRAQGLLSLEVNGRFRSLLCQKEYWSFQQPPHRRIWARTISWEHAEWLQQVAFSLYCLYYSVLCKILKYLIKQRLGQYPRKEKASKSQGPRFYFHVNRDLRSFELLVLFLSESEIFHLTAPGFLTFILIGGKIIPIWFKFALFLITSG